MGLIIILHTRSLTNKIRQHHKFIDPRGTKSWSINCDHLHCWSHISLSPCVCVCVWSKTVSEIHREITAQLPALLNPDTFIPCSTGTQNDVMGHVC